MSHLVIDIGNSRTKLAVFEGRKLIQYDRLGFLSVSILRDYLKHNTIEKSIISSVSDDIGLLENVLIEKTNYVRFSAAINTGVINQYKSPDTLGLDRLAGVIGARALYPGRNCLVIDMGTCITYDAISSEGIYKGGSIAPGLHMRLRAMHELTGRLPLIELDDFDDLEVSATPSSMLSGVVIGTFSEFIGFIEQYSLLYSDLQVILCGGDANFFDTRLKNSIFAHTLKTVPDLVLIGLNEVTNQQ